MEKFEAKKFNIPKLKGISAENIEEHLKLYAGYVKNANLVLSALNGEQNLEIDTYALAELQRRFGFEFDGMRNHEYFFSAFEGGPDPLTAGHQIYREIEATWGSFEGWLVRFKSVAAARGVGWAVLYYDQQTKKLLNQWVDEHHISQLATCSIILALDMWEHAFVADYQPSGKKQYIEDFFANLNWQKIEENFLEATT